MQDLTSRIIKDLRERAGISQNRVAKYIGITQQQYSKIESGKRPLKHYELSKIADYYNVSTDYLLGKKSKYEIKNDGRSIEQVNNRGNYNNEISKDDIAEILQDLLNRIK